MCRSAFMLPYSRSKREYMNNFRLGSLNRDGQIDAMDAAVLYDLIESSPAETRDPFFEGGLASYGSTSAHGPFVQVDVRGFRARW